jgi:D-aminoacyl-tRNA deacylase
MRALLQRVTEASVTVEDQPPRKIQQGLVVFLAVAPSDTEKDIAWLVEKILNMRLFPPKDPAKPGSFDQTVQDMDGELLVVSQFTLYGETRKGRRPDFTGAADPEKARIFYDTFIQVLQNRYPKVQTGEFGARMRVDIRNDGPVTILVDTPLLTAAE